MLLSNGDRIRAWHYGTFWIWTTFVGPWTLKWTSSLFSVDRLTIWTDKSLKLTFLRDTRVKDNRALKYPYRLVFDLEREKSGFMTVLLFGIVKSVWKSVEPEPQLSPEFQFLKLTLNFTPLGNEDGISKRTKILTSLLISDLSFRTVSLNTHSRLLLLTPNSACYPCA